MSAAPQFVASQTMETLSAAARRLGAELHGDDAAFGAVSTDTRSLAPGDLFVALSGPNFDGHEFVAQAAARSAAGALVARRVDQPLPQIVVDDTLAALQAYAAAWRSEFTLPVAAVTGSNGKTSVKQCLAAVLAPMGTVLATHGNLNNHIGVPLMLCRLRAEHRAAVFELGANHAGEIAALAQWVQPKVGIVTNAGDAHLEGFGSRDGVAHAKGELFQALGSEGVAVINADDAYAPLWTGFAGAAARIRFALDAEADVTATDLAPTPRAAPTAMEFTLHGFGRRAPVALPLPGRHNVANALAAAAAGFAMGLQIDEIAAGLARVEAPAGRLRWRAARRGARLLDDSYNANPGSLAAGLALLAAVEGRRWLVLGDMAELGGQAEAAHLRAGRSAREAGVERVYAVGRHADCVVTGFGRGAVAYDSVDALLAELSDAIDAEVAVLVKGSRSARMERVVQGLAAGEN